MMLTDNHQRYCSGVLLNNARRDGTQFFLTAKHCVRDDVSYYITGFNYEKQRCESGPFGAGRNKNFIAGANDEADPTCPRAKALEKSCRHSGGVRGQAGPTIDLDLDSMLQPQTVQGFELVAEWDRTDFALLKIKERIPDHYNVFLAGYDATDGHGRGTFTGIHHPMGDFKKISSYNGPLMKSAWIDDPEHLVHWQVLAWSRGTTERGSSGSPLFNKHGMSIGHLRGGFSSCENIMGADFYGGIAWDWSGDGSPRHSLAPHLDPEGKGVKVLAGMRLNAARFMRQQHKIDMAGMLNATNATAVEEPAAEGVETGTEKEDESEEKALYPHPIPKSLGFHLK